MFFIRFRVIAHALLIPGEKTRMNPFDTGVGVSGGFCQGAPYYLLLALRPIICLLAGVVTKQSVGIERLKSKTSVGNMLRRESKKIQMQYSSRLILHVL